MLEDVEKVDVAALMAERDLWRRRAHEQAAHVRALTRAVAEISDKVSVVESYEWGQEHDGDLLICSNIHCDNEGWPEDGFVFADNGDPACPKCAKLWRDDPT